MTFKMYRYAVLCAFLVFESSQEVRSENPGSGSDYAGEINPGSNYGFGAPDTNNDGYNPPAGVTQESASAPSAQNYGENENTHQITESRTYSVPSDHSEINVEEQQIRADRDAPTYSTTPANIPDEAYRDEAPQVQIQETHLAQESPQPQDNSRYDSGQTSESKQNDQHHQEIPSDHNTLNQSELPPMSEHDIQSSATTPTENVNFDADAEGIRFNEAASTTGTNQAEYGQPEQRSTMVENEAQTDLGATNDVTSSTEHRDQMNTNLATDPDYQNHEMNATELQAAASQNAENQNNDIQNSAENENHAEKEDHNIAENGTKLEITPDVLPNETLKTEEQETRPVEPQNRAPESGALSQELAQNPDLENSSKITVEENNLPVTQHPMNVQQNPKMLNEKSSTKSNQASEKFPVHPAAIARITPPEFLPTPGITAPSYTKLTPVLGWSRHLADSASTLKQWLRWWQYLNMKTPVIMPWIDGLNLRVYPDNEVYRAMYVKGIYDPNFSIAINSVLTKGGTFIDAGANIGNYSLLASRVVGDGGHIIAIEPSSRDYDRLVDNIKLNNLDNIIRPYKFALSEKNGEKAVLQIANEERSGLNTFGTEFSVKGVTRVRTEEVETSTLDSFVERTGLENVEALKMDIEGSELKALHGAINTITRFRPVVMIGVNEVSLKASGTTREEVQKFMQDHRYKMYKVSYKPRFAFVPIDEVSKTHAKVLFCFHESLMPPELPQPEHKSLMDYVRDFFSK